MVKRNKCEKNKKNKKISKFNNTMKNIKIITGTIKEKNRKIRRRKEIEEARGSFNSKKDILTKKKNELLSNKQEIIKQINQVDEEIE